MIQFNPNQFVPNKPIEVRVLANGVDITREIYQINPKHRDGSPNKSQWTIRNNEEVAVFGWALEHNSQSDGYYWGVFYDGLTSRVLGQTAKHQDTKIARFECSAQPRIWHGYPVDYLTDPQHDRPNRTVLLEWAHLNIIKKHQIAKLTGGQGWKD